MYCVVKLVRGQKTQRTEAPRFCQLGQKPRDTFIHMFLQFIRYIDHIFPIKQKLYNRCHTFCIMLTIKRALDQISRRFCIYVVNLHSRCNQ